MNILLVSLGCDKNLCDSETMLGILKANNYNLTNDENEADAVIVNTCSFIHDAMEESINTILEMAQLKQNRLKYLIVTGCLAQRFKDEICDEIPEIDAVLGASSFDRILEAIKQLEKNDKQKVLLFDSTDRLAVSNEKRVNTTGNYMGYLKIAEGCNKFCTYCVIPYIRGKYRSVPMENLIEQAMYMAECGTKEIVLVAQETTCYGIDLYGKKNLHELINKLSEIDGIKWIRVLYCYPEEITDELIECFRTNKKLCHYIDMPLQHSEDAILKRMGRRTSKQDITDVINKLRSAVPDICLRTTFITGFPGETKEEHDALLSFIDEIEFDRLGVFTYSKEDGTAAANFPDQIPNEIATAWRNDIMELQQEISQDKNDEMVGKTVSVIIEGYSTEEDIYVGRTYKDAPNVDGLCFVNCDYELISGSIVKVKITNAGPYDLIGDIEDEFTE